VVAVRERGERDRGASLKANTAISWPDSDEVENGRLPDQRFRYWSYTASGTRTGTGFERQKMLLGGEASWQITVIEPWVSSIVGLAALRFAAPEGKISLDL
jgi:hypothetical protein